MRTINDLTKLKDEVYNDKLLEKDAQVMLIAEMIEQSKMLYDLIDTLK